MKVRYILPFMLVLMLVVIPMATTTVYANDEIRVTIDGQYVAFEAQSPTIVDGRTLVPIRDVFEMLGFDIIWNPAAYEVVLLRDYIVIVITIGNDKFFRNGEPLNLDVPAKIIGDSTMLPIRALLSSVGYFVYWDNEQRTVIINSPPTPIPEVVSFYMLPMFLGEAFFDDIDVPIERFRFYHDGHGNIFAEYDTIELIPRLFSVTVDDINRIKFTPIDPDDRTLVSFMIFEGLWSSIRFADIGLGDTNDIWFDLIGYILNSINIDTNRNRIEIEPIDTEEVIISFFIFNERLFWYRWEGTGFSNRIGYSVPSNMPGTRSVPFNPTLRELQTMLQRG